MNEVIGSFLENCNEQINAEVKWWIFHWFNYWRQNGPINGRVCSMANDWPRHTKYRWIRNRKSAGRGLSVTRNRSVELVYVFWFCCLHLFVVSQHLSCSVRETGHEIFTRPVARSVVFFCHNPKITIDRLGRKVCGRLRRLPTASLLAALPVSFSSRQFYLAPLKAIFTFSVVIGRLIESRATSNHVVGI